MILSRLDLEEIGAAVINDFHNFFRDDTSFSGKRCAAATPIDLFASRYLGLRVSYTRLSSDGSLCGLTAYADTEYKITELGVTRTIPLKRNQVLLDSSFLRPGYVNQNSGRRRFTLAHECAHQILFQLAADTQKSVCMDQYLGHKAYSLRDLKYREDWNEWQANVLGAAILMPQKEVNCFMQSLAGGRKLKNYGGRFSNSDQVVLISLCHTFEVSRSAALIRLKGLGYIEDLSRSKYVDPLEILA